MNLTGPWLTTRSDGSATLSDALRIAVFDYQRRFDHEPKLIVIPYFRRDEMPDVATFRGIPFRFTIVADHIELRGSP